MKALYLRAGSYEEMRGALIAAGVLVELEGGNQLPAAGVWLAMLGTIFSKPATNEDGEPLAPVPLDGYHANLTIYPAFAGDLTPLKACMIEAPSAPYMPHG